jgi:hypothetical protein
MAMSEYGSSFEGYRIELFDGFEALVLFFQGGWEGKLFHLISFRVYFSLMLYTKFLMSRA